MDVQHFDVLIVGAGISGIGAGYHLQKNCPNKSYAILEGREKLGGTWDLFRYPGIRSDSDMHTMGYSFKPWTSAQSIANGDSICQYLKDTAREFGIDKKIRYGQTVTSASWCSQNALWTLTIKEKLSAKIKYVSCHFLYMCSGYYNYQAPYIPEFKNKELFNGPIIHPQLWPEDLNYQNKKVVVIGSGATAMTLVPAMAKKASHVIMLQRSPSYIISRPSKDSLAGTLQKILPQKLAYGITRWKNIFLASLLYQFCKYQPKQAKTTLISKVISILGKEYNVKKHFTPNYKPWDQRLCLVPDNDLFNSIKQNKASVVTDKIIQFTQDGIQLKSGKKIEADIIISATGLNMQLLSNINIEVDNEKIDISQSLCYKGLMLSGVPNMALSLGYSNASWTLKSDLIAKYVCRLLNHMDKKEYGICTPSKKNKQQKQKEIMNLSSGYVHRASKYLPKQGLKFPWTLFENYLLDKFILAWSSVQDKNMVFAKTKDLKAKNINDKPPFEHAYKQNTQ